MAEHSEEITPAIFDHLMELAALSLGEDEAEYLRRELNQQLAAIQELQAIAVGDDIPPASHGVPYPEESRPGLRLDDWRPSDKSGSITAQAPQFEGGYIIVPDIPHTTLE